jgi:hypothetical protein
MPAKPHRVLLDRVSGYADEAAAYLRRRRHLRKPFARTSYPDGRTMAFGAESEEGGALFLAASHLIEVADARVLRRREGARQRNPFRAGGATRGEAKP